MEKKEHQTLKCLNEFEGGLECRAPGNKAVCLSQQVAPLAADASLRSDPSFCPSVKVLVAKHTQEAALPTWQLSRSIQRLKLSRSFSGLWENVVADTKTFKQQSDVKSCPHFVFLMDSEDCHEPSPVLLVCVTV